MVHMVARTAYLGLRTLLHTRKIRPLLRTQDIDLP
jgi:hypothetical protein